MDDPTGFLNAEQSLMTSLVQRLLASDRTEARELARELANVAWERGESRTANAAMNLAAALACPDVPYLKALKTLVWLGP